MDLNVVAVQLSSLLSSVCSNPITFNFTSDLADAKVEAELANNFVESVVEEICSYPHVDALAISTRTNAEGTDDRRVSLVINVRTYEAAAPEPRTQAMRALSLHLRKTGAAVRLLTIAGRWVRYEFLFPTRPAHAFHAQTTGEGQTILLVEDEDFVRSITAEVLKSCGYSVLTAKDATDAIEVFQQNQGTIKLLLTDVVMPGDSGTALADRLSAIDPLLKVILMSGYADCARDEDDGGEGRTSYLAKPFSSKSLLAAIGGLLEAPAIDAASMQAPVPYWEPARTSAVSGLVYPELSTPG